MRREEARAVAGAILLALAFAPVRPAAAEPRALLIGVQDYGAQGGPWEDLQGPGNDMDLVRTVLRDRFQFPDANIRVLRGAETTRIGILAALDRLVRDTRAGDVVYVHYSGHGAAVPDANGDEAGRRFDAALVPRDGGPEGAYYILDDEIALWLHKLLARTDDVVLVIDACHSGTITRSASSLRIRRAPVEDTRSYDWSDTLTAALREIGAADTQAPRFVRLSACLDSQAAWEYRADDGKVYGRFTWFWCRALLAAGPGQTFGEVFDAAQALTQSVPSGRQEPRLEGAADRLLFQGRFREHGTQVAVVRAEDGRVTLSGGVLDGVTPGSLFRRVWSADAGDATPLKIKILDVGAVEATGETVEGSLPRPGDLFEESAHVPRRDPLRVFVDASGAPEWKASVESALGRIQRTVIVPKGEIPDMLLRLSKEGARVRCEILDATEGPFGAGRYERERLRERLTDPDDLVLLSARVESLARREELLTVAGVYEEALPLVTVELAELEPVTGTPPQEEILDNLDLAGHPDLKPAHARTVPRESRGAEWAALPEKSVITFRVRNRSLSPWYVVLFNLKPDGTLERLFPTQGSEDNGQVPPGTRTLPLPVELVDAGQVDTYLCFVSERPAVLDRMQDLPPLPPEGELGPTVRGGTDPSFELIGEWMEGLGGPTLRGGAAPGGQLAARRFSVRVEKAR